jgi:hypothetical protein
MFASSRSPLVNAVFHFAVVLCLCAVGCAARTSNAPVGYGGLAITVTDASTGAVVTGATVRIANWAATTGDDGTCSFASAATGRTAIEVTKPGYVADRFQTDVFPNVVVMRTLSLAVAPEPASYDVVVVGAGTGGVAAALQAARMGASVALLEESDWIGGQMTAAAVTSLDEGPAHPHIRSGIYKEFVDKVLGHYASLNKSTGTAYFNPRSIAFEPGVGQRALYDLVHEADERTTGGRSAVDLYLTAEVSEVLKDDMAVRGVTLTDGTTIRSTVVIDASEYGDVLPLAGARYRVGNSTSDSVVSTACTQAITYTAVVRQYLDGMDPAFRFSSPPPGYETVAEQYRRSVTDDGQFLTTIPVHFAFHNSYRGMPDSANPSNYEASPDQMGLITKTGINWFNDYPVTVEYVENRQRRKAMDCGAKLRTLQFVYYLQQDLGHVYWSVTNDEGFDTPYNVAQGCPDIPPDFKALERHLPLKPYVREGRRAIGLMTLTAADIRREGTNGVAARGFPSALAVGDYPADLHGCAQTADLDCGDTAADWTRGAGPFQVPFEVFIPEAVDGLVLAEKNLSVSRLVNGAIRLQPITMATGQAAGAIAALAVEWNLQPRRLKPVDVQWALLESGAVLSLYNPSDVPVGHGYWKHLQLALVHGLATFNGERFDIDASMREADMADVLERAFGTPLAVAQPERLATRGEFAVALATAMRLDLTRAPTPEAYVDVPSWHAAFRPVQLLHAMGILEDGGGTFDPERTIARGDVVYYTVNAALGSQTSMLDRGAP